MEAVKKTLKILCQVTYKIISWLSMLLLAVMVGSVIMAVFGRYLFHKAPAWSEELAIVCIVWLCMLSAQIGVYRGLHIRMTLIENLLPERIYKVFYRYANLVPLVINVLLVYFGCQIAMSNGTNRLPSSGWPMIIEYLAVIISGATGIILTVGRMVEGEEI